MNCKIYFFMLATLVCAVTSRPRRVQILTTPSPPPCSCNLATTIGLIEELATLVEAPPCGCGGSGGCGSCRSCGCGCKDVPLCTDVILPPLAVELPCGLGYLPSAAPLVAAAFDCYGPCSSCVPITSPCSCTRLATPQCPELRAYAKPIIL